MTTETLPDCMDGREAFGKHEKREKNNPRDAGGIMNNMAVLMSTKGAGLAPENAVNVMISYALNKKIRKIPLHGGCAYVEVTSSEDHSAKFGLEPKVTERARELLIESAKEQSIEIDDRHFHGKHNEDRVIISSSKSKTVYKPDSFRIDKKPANKLLTDLLNTAQELGYSTNSVTEDQVINTAKEFRNTALAIITNEGPLDIFKVKPGRIVPIFHLAKFVGRTTNEEPVKRKTIFSFSNVG